MKNEESKKSENECSSLKHPKIYLTILLGLQGFLVLVMITHFLGLLP